MNNYTLTIESFSGPLDLLLTLLDQQKLHITDIALSEITEQYISYLDGLSEERERELADFLVIATKLLFLKSRSLLPQLFPEEEKDGPSLEEQLRLYRRFREASMQLNERWEANARAFFRTEPTRRVDNAPPPENLRVESLRISMVQLLDRLKPPKPLPKTQIDRTVSIKEKIKDIQAELRRVKQANFFGLIQDRNNTSEVIVGFLALLELVKQRHIGIAQEASFSDIVIRKA